jgi:hypothetical protein
MKFTSVPDSSATKIASSRSGQMEQRLHASCYLSCSEGMQEA